MKQGKHITVRVYTYRLDNGGGCGWGSMAEAVRTKAQHERPRTGYDPLGPPSPPGQILTRLLTVWADGTELYGPSRPWRPSRARAYPYARSL